MTADVTPDGAIFVLRHDCEAVGDVEFAEDWRFCPWCGRGAAQAQRRAQRRRDRRSRALAALELLS